jgi:hypothetical protein
LTHPEQVRRRQAPDLFFNPLTMNPKNILCASHGTDGARAAEAAALELCGTGTALHHLIVVPDFWKG